MKRQIGYNLINLLSRLINFFLFWFIANQLGASLQSDWFFYIFGIVYFFTSIFFYTTECTLVPSWNDLNPENQNDFFRAATSLAIVIVVPLQIVGILLSFIIPEFFNLHPPQNTLLVTVVSLLFFLQPSIAFISSIYTSYLQASGKYFAPITHLTYRAIGIVCVLLLAKGHYTILIFTIAYTFGELFRLVMLYYLTTPRPPLPFRKINIQLSKFRRLYTDLLMMAFTTCSFAANPYIDFLMGAQTGPGNATLVEYGARLRGLPFLLLNGALIVLLGDWVRKKKETIQWDEVRQAAILFGSIGLICSLAFLVLREKFIDIFFLKNTITSLQQENLSGLLFWYILGIPLLISANVFGRGILTLKLFKIYTIIGATSFFMNIALNYLLIKTVGIQGIAMSTTLLDGMMLLALSAILKYRCNASVT